LRAAMDSGCLGLLGLAIAALATVATGLLIVLA
jgi:hypothetical protein